MSEIRIERVTRRFGAFAAVDDLDATFRDGEVTCLLGPSGCGKTTLMRMVAGLETPTAGRILFDGRDVTRLSPGRRDVGMVFQYPVMYPTLTVRENIEEPLRRMGLTAAERDRRVDAMLDVLDMRPLARATIDALDAGLRQRVAVGRAVVRECAIVLFDEPTTNIEVNAKLQLIRAFKAVTRRLRQTIVYVTHDQTEAMTLADRIALMKDGRIVQHAAPRALYDRPATPFGGWFLGSPGMNFVPARLEGGRLASAILPAPVAAPPGLAAAREISLGIRPERVALGRGPLRGVVRDRVIGIGGRPLLRVALGDRTLGVRAAAGAAAQPGEAVALECPADALRLFADGRAVDWRADGGA